MEAFFLLTLLGLLFGSFLSAVSFRIPRGLQFISGRSFCDNCKKSLYWYDNIPLLSFLFYKGSSRCCNKRISIRYPLIEIVTALGFVTLYHFSFPIAYYFIYVITLLILVIDIEFQIIPDVLTWILFLISLLILLESSLFSSLLAGFIFSLFLLSLYFVTNGRGMGLGDVKLVIPLGMLVGLNNLVYFICLSFIAGGIVSAIMLILKRAKLNTKIAFGPFIIIGFWSTVLFFRIF